MMKQNEAIQDNIKGRKFVVLPNLMHNEKVRREKKFDVAIRNVSLLCSQELIKSRRILMIAGGCISGILGLQSTRVRSKNLSLSLSLCFPRVPIYVSRIVNISGIILFLCYTNDYIRDANLSNEI